MSESSPQRPWYNNCRLGALMSDDQRDEFQDKFYASLPMTDARAEWDRLFCQPVSKDQPKKSGRKACAKKKSTKRKARQTKIKKFFKPELNDDGYPISQCRYHPDLQKHVYAPVDYGNNHLSNEKIFKDLCHHCMLSPCIVQEHYYDAWSLSWNKSRNSKEKLANSTIRAEIQEFLQKKHCKWFKKCYSKKRPVPGCIKKHVAQELHVYGYNETDEDDSTDSDSGYDSD